MTYIISHDDDHSGLLRISAGNLTRIRHQLRRALEEAQHVYAFNPNSYTYGLHSALLAVETTFEAAFGPDDYSVTGNGDGDVWGNGRGS